LATLTPEEQAALNVLLEEYKTTLGEIGKETKAQLERRQAFEKVERQIADIQGEATKINKTRLDELNEAQVENQEAAKTYQKEIDKINKELRDSKDLTKEQREEMEAEVEALEQQLALHELIKKQLAEQEEYQKEIRATAEDLLGTFTGIKEQQSGVVGLLQKGMNDGRSFGSSLKNVGSSMLGRFKELATPINIGAMGAAKIVESTAMMVINTDNALARFNEMTTAGGKLNDVVFDVTADTREFGVNMEQTVAAAGDLYTGMSAFTEMTKEAQSATLELASALTKAGVAAKDTAQIQDLAMKGFAMSSAEANNVSLELLATAQALNVPAGKMASDFNSAMDELAKYGPEGIEVFKELSAQAKAAGVEMSTLLGIAKGFDTIEGAAESTSKLNAILGSTMNTMEMLNATESQRIQLIKDSVSASGRSFASMDRHEKQAIATAAGISSMADAEKLFGTNSAAFDEAMGKIEGVTGSTADLEGATSASTSMQEKMTLIMEQMAVAVMPLIRALTGLLDIIMFILTPVFWLINGFFDLAEAFGEATGMGKQMGVALFTAAAALALFVKFSSMDTFLTTLNRGYDLVAGLGARIQTLQLSFVSLKTSIMTTAVTMKTKFLTALATAKTSLMSFGTMIYTKVITPLLAGIKTTALFAMNMITKFVTAILTGVGKMIIFGVTMVINVVGALALAIGKMIIFGITMLISFIKPLAIAVGGVIAFGISLLSVAIPALLAVTAAVIGFTVALLTNPIVLIGMAIAAVAYLIYDNYEMLFDFMISGFTAVGDIFSTIGNGLASVFIGIADSLKGIVNSMLGGVNSMINGINTISFTIPDWVPLVGGESFGINIPLIPLLEEGGEIAGDGAAYLHQGEKVVPAAQVQQLDDSIQTASSMLVAAPMMAMAIMNPTTMRADAAVGAPGGGQAGESGVVSAIKETTDAVNALLAAMGSGGATAPGGGTTVVLELNERQLGKAVTKVLNDKNSLTVG